MTTPTPDPWRNTPDDPHWRANAILIAAAPDLLAACKIALRRLRDLGDECVDGAEGMSPSACEALRAAIARAGAE